MIEQNTLKVDFSDQTEYRMGGVTYKVAAFFDETERPLKEKIQRLLKDSVQKENRTIAAGKDDRYN